MEGRKKVYFIYTQKGEKNNIKTFDINERIRKVKDIEKNIGNDYIQILYCVDISKKDNENHVKISLIDNEGDYYYSIISFNAYELFGEKEVDTDEYIIFDLKFLDMHNSEKNKLGQFILSYNEQFSVFERKFKNNKDSLLNLYSGSIPQILLKTNQKFDLVMHIFFELFNEKYNEEQRLKEILNYFFQNIDKILLKTEYVADLNIEKEKLNLLSNSDNIRAKLIKSSGAKEENIDIFLAYYYIYYNKKEFIKFINNEKYKDSLTKNLITHRKIFGDFTSEIINPELIDEAESVSEVESLVKLFPNIVECYKVLANKTIFSKLAIFEQMYKKKVNLMEFLKPSINDNIKILQKYFNEVYDLFKNESIYPVILKNNFFEEYYKCFGDEEEDFNKNLIIIEMVKLYNTRMSKSKKINTNNILEMHLKKGMILLRKKKLKNENFMKFIELFPDLSQNKEFINLFPNGIDFSEKNNTFIEDILNDDKYGLEYFLGYNYQLVFEKIFEKFVLPKDLLVFKTWKINDEPKPILISLFMKTIKRVWFRDPENNMYGLENLISMVFAKASDCMNNYLSIIKSIEERIAPEKLMSIYSNILNRNFDAKYHFKEHMKKFISNNKDSTAVYLWFEMCTLSDNNKKSEYLKDNLKTEFAVRYSDFASYPKFANERITLFTKLKNFRFLSEIKNTEYYERSMAAKNNLEKNTFKDATIMYFNLQKIFDFINNFFIENEMDYYLIQSSVINIRELFDKAKKYYDDLKTIQKYWETFFPNEKKESLEKLEKQIDKFENTKLEDIEKEIQSDKAETSKYLAEAEEGIEFIDSIFFMAIYNRYTQQKESIRYKLCILHFKNLEKLGENNDLTPLNDELKRIIINAVDKKENLLQGELEFLMKYFKFGENGKYKNFNIKSIKNNIQNSIKNIKKGGITEININRKIKRNKENLPEKEKKKDINENKIIKQVRAKSINAEEIDKKMNNIIYLSKELLYNFNIIENSDNKLYESYINFYREFYNIGINLSQLSLEEINDNLIPLSYKYFYLGKNLGIIDNTENKDDIPFLQEFNFMLQIIELFKKEKSNYVTFFMAFKEIYNNCQQNNLDKGELNSLLEVLKNIIPKYGTNYIYIEIFLMNFEMKCSKMMLLTFMLDEKYSFLYGDMFPIFDKIFSEEIKEKFKFINTKDLNYYEFNSEEFSEINNLCRNNQKDDLGEMLFFYFESEIMNQLNKNQKKNPRYIESKNEQLKNFVDTLEKIYKDINKNFISVLFSIAFVKCYVYKLIEIIQENRNNIGEIEYLFNNILRFKDGLLSPIRTTIKLYVLKLIMYYHGNFSDIKNLDLKQYCIEDFRPKLESNDKEYGFDYLFMPLQLNTNDESYNSIITKFFDYNKILENEDIKEEMNNNIDMLFCFFVNFDFSRYYNSTFFDSPEYTILNNYFLEIKDKVFKDNELIKKLFLYFIDFKDKDKNVYKEFKYFTYDQILSLLISTRFIINIILPKNEKSLFYNLLNNDKETIYNNQKFFNDYFMKDYKNEISDNLNISCLTHEIINYIILSHIYFVFEFNEIKYDDIKNITSLKQLEDKDAKNTSDYLLEQIFQKFNFIKNTLLPLLGINNIILFMNSIFKDIFPKLINFQSADDDEKIKKNMESIDSIVNVTITKYSKSVKEYYENEKSSINENNENNTDEIFDIIEEKSEFYNNNELINKNYPLLSYFTYCNFSVLNKDFENQFFYFNNNNSSDYPLINSIFCKDSIFNIIEFLPNLNKFINQIHNELNMRYSEEEIKNKTIKGIFGGKFADNLTTLNSFIETNNILFEKNKKINEDDKIFELINLPGSYINYIYQKIIEKYNEFLSKMKNFKNFDEVIIQEAKENDYNINHIIKNATKITIEEELDQLILLYSKRERKINNEINVYDGGKIIYDFATIENKLEEQFIFGKKKFSENHREFIFSSDIFNQEDKIQKEFEKKYPQKKINNEDKNNMEQNIQKLKKKNEGNVINLFYELFFVLKYVSHNSQMLKMKNLKDLIKYLEQRQYEFTQLKNAINQLKDSLSLDLILYFYEITENEAFNYLTSDIEKEIRGNKINIDEKVIKDIEDCLDNNNIIKKDIVISAMKKHILRNIKVMDTNEKNYNYLFDLKDLNINYLWDFTIFGSNEFKEEFNKLVNLDNNEKYVVYYLYLKIYNIELDDGGEGGQSDNEFQDPGF